MTGRRAAQRHDELAAVRAGGFRQLLDSVSEGGDADRRGPLGHPLQHHADLGVGRISRARTGEPHAIDGADRVSPAALDPTAADG